MNDSKARSLIKTVVWRIVAITNSFLVLSFNFTSINFYNALIMNVSGMLLFFVFERIFNKVKYGKINEI